MIWQYECNTPPLFLHHQVPDTDLTSVQLVRLTVKLLDGEPVIHGQFKVDNVFHGTLIVRPHDGWIRGGMRKAQCMTKLMHCNCEQVCTSAITCGSVKEKCYRFTRKQKKTHLKLDSGHSG